PTLLSSSSFTATPTPAIYTLSLHDAPSDLRLFLSTDSGSVGLNLQVASAVVNVDLPWNPAKLEQRIARAWRKNQTRSVTVVNLVDRKSTRLNSSHVSISYAVFCLKKKTNVT